MRLVSVASQWNSLFSLCVSVAFGAVLGFCNISKILGTMSKRWKNVENSAKKMRVLVASSGMSELLKGR